MVYLLVFVLLLCVGVVALLAFMKRDSGPPDATYVCDQCGEHHCICRKEEQVS